MDFHRHIDLEGLRIGGRQAGSGIQVVLDDVVELRAVARHLLGDAGGWRASDRKSSPPLPGPAPGRAHDRLRRLRLARDPRTPSAFTASSTLACSFIGAPGSGQWGVGEKVSAVRRPGFEDHRRRLAFDRWRGKFREQAPDECIGVLRRTIDRAGPRRDCDGDHLLSPGGSGPQVKGHQAEDNRKAEFRHDTLL